MKSAREVQLLAKDNPSYKILLDFDNLEINNPDEFALPRINYRNRIEKIIGIVKSRFQDSSGIKVADIGCAQGNTSLLLGEAGYSVTAIDLRKEYLEYSKLKYEKGDVKWMASNIEDLELQGQETPFHVIILGELIEHCAFPEEIIQTAFKLLMKDGILIITTPNANFLTNKLPTFSSIKDRSELASKQFGPDGADHLFLFELSDMMKLLPAEARIEESGYIGCALFNTRTSGLIRIFPISWIYGAIRLFEKFFPVNKYLSQGLYWVLKKS